MTGSISGSAIAVALDGVVKATAGDATFPAGSLGVHLGSETNRAQHRADNFSAIVQ